MQLLDLESSINSKGHLLLLGFVSFSLFLLKLFLFKVIALQKKRKKKKETQQVQWAVWEAFLYPALSIILLLLLTLDILLKKKKKVLFLLFLTVPMQSLKFHMIIMNVFVDSGSVQCFSIHLGNNLTVRVKGMGA